MFESCQITSNLKFYSITLMIHNIGRLDLSYTKYSTFSKQHPEVLTATRDILYNSEIESARKEHCKALYKIDKIIGVLTSEECYGLRIRVEIKNDIDQFNRDITDA